MIKARCSMTRQKRRLVMILVPFLFTILASVARSQNITEFSIPTVSAAPYGIAAGPDGAVWFTESAVNQIGRITIAGAITEFTIPTPNSTPFGIAAGPDGAVWFTESYGNKIGRITTGGVITEFPIPTASSVPIGIAAGPDGALWFTENAGNRIGRITTAGAVIEFAVPTSNSGPLSIASGLDGALWFTENVGNKIGRITTTGIVTEFAVPTAGSQPFSIACGFGSFGVLCWFTESGGKIGRINTAGFIDEVDVSLVIGTRLTGITVSPDDTAWFAEAGNNEIGGIFLARNSRTGFTGAFFRGVTRIPTANAGPYGITAGPDGALWFTEQMSNKIGRLTTGSVAGSCTPSSSSLCLNSGRFKVEVSWGVPSQGTSGVGTVVPLTGDAGVVWFFSSNNYELLVKVLDGRAFNGRFWFFSAPATNVGYTITVTDTVNNVVKTYTSLEGQVTNIQDTGGFLP